MKEQVFTNQEEQIFDLFGAFKSWMVCAMFT